MKALQNLIPNSNKVYLSNSRLWQFWLLFKYLKLQWDCGLADGQSFNVGWSNWVFEAASTSSPGGCPFFVLFCFVWVCAWEFDHVFSLLFDMESSLFIRVLVHFYWFLFTNSPWIWATESYVLIYQKVMFLLSTWYESNVPELLDFGLHFNQRTLNIQTVAS